MQPAAVIILIIAILVGLAVISAALTFLVKTVKGTSTTTRHRSSGKTAKKVSLWRLIKALRAEEAELTKDLWIRSQDSSEKPTEKLPKGTYPVDGVVKNDEGVFLLSLINGDSFAFVRLVDSINFISKSKDDPDDEDNEDEDD